MDSITEWTGLRNGQDCYKSSATGSRPQVIVDRSDWESGCTLFALDIESLYQLAGLRLV